MQIQQQKITETLDSNKLLLYYIDRNILLLKNSRKDCFEDV
jgi:hypothetical protein